MLSGRNEESINASHSGIISRNLSYTFSIALSSTFIIFKRLSKSLFLSLRFLPFNVKARSSLSCVMTNLEFYRLSCLGLSAWLYMIFQFFSAISNSQSSGISPSKKGCSILLTNGSSVRGNLRLIGSAFLYSR